MISACSMYHHHHRWLYSPGWALASSVLFFRFRNNIFLLDGFFGLTPNPQLGTPGYPFLSGSSPLTWMAWEALRVAYPTASIALRIIRPHKPHLCTKVGVPLEGCSMYGEKRNSQMVLVGKPEGKRSRRRRMCKWEGMGMNLRETDWKKVDGINMAQDGTCGGLL